MTKRTVNVDLSPRNLSFFGTFLSFVILFVVAFGSLAPAAVDFPVAIQVINFGGTSLMQGTETILRPNGTQGRYKTERVGAMRKGGTCADFLTTFQARPLNVMRQDGYISEKVYETLTNVLKNNLDARQLLLVTLFSDLTPEEATATFGPKGVPKDRIMDEFTDENKRKIVRVSRGSLYAVRGQTLDVTSKDFAPKTVPWELDKPLPSGLERPFDRGRVRAMVEVGRAHSENDILKGDLRLASKIIFANLETEFHFLGVPAEEVLVTAHFMDAQHTRFFSTQFPMRPLNKDLQTTVEQDPKAALANYLSIPLPRGHKEWAKYSDTITFGSLAALTAKNPVEEFSETAQQIVERSGGRVTGKNALHLIIEFVSALREDFNYSLEGYGASKAPVMLRDRGTSFTGAKMAHIFRRYGLPEGTKEFNAVKEWIENLYFNPEPDLFMGGWTESHYFMRKQGPGKGTFQQALEVMNLDVDAANQRPVEYLASVILSVSDLVNARIEGATAEVYNETLKWTNEARKKKGLALVSEVNKKIFFETFPLVLASSDPGVMNQLRILGGRTTSATALNFNFSEGPQKISLNLGMVETEMFEFGGTDIQNIAQGFPGLARNAKNRLKAGGHPMRINLLHSSYK